MEGVGAGGRRWKAKGKVFEACAKVLQAGKMQRGRVHRWREPGKCREGVRGAFPQVVGARRLEGGCSQHGHR